MSRSYRLHELAEACGVKPRTIRYYVQRGLLPAPTFRGPETAYVHDHLMRLLAIKRLQERFWSLDAIASHLAELEGEALESWLMRLVTEPAGETLPPDLSRLAIALPARPSSDIPGVAFSRPESQLDTDPDTETDPELARSRIAARESSIRPDAASGVSRWLHYHLAPGVELQLDPEHASDAARAFVEDILDLARRYRLRSF